MPEGWKRLKDCHDDLYPNDLCDLNVLKALELLREMAEALDAEIFHNRDYWGVETDYNKKPLSPTTRSEAVLKKFKEWK